MLGTATSRRAPRFAQAVFYASAFFRSDGGTPSAPAPQPAGLVRERKPLAAFYADLKMKDSAHEIP